MFKIIMTAIVIFNLSNFIVTNVQAKDSLKGLSKSDFLDAYEEKAEEFWESFSLLYSRVNPNLKELVPGKEWDDKDRVISSCIYDKMQAIGKIDEYIEAIDNLDSMVTVIKSNEDITVFTLDDYPEVEQMTEVEGYVEAMSSCGQMKLMQERMAKTGLWQKLMQSMPDDMK